MGITTKISSLFIFVNKIPVHLQKFSNENLKIFAMKKTCIFLLTICSFLFVLKNGNSQTTIVLQPDESSSKDANIWNITPTSNYGNHTDFIATAWTNSGNLSLMRGLIDFDLSGIPANSTIQSATLSLYYHSSTANIGHSQSSGSNACWLQRITSPWDENTVTWSNQPTSTTQNQVNIVASSNDSMSYPNIDVTNLISDIYNNPSAGYGLMLRLQTELNYRSLLFASSGESIVAKRPRLTVTYVPATPTNDTCVVIRLGAETGKDADVWNIYPTTNYGSHPDFIATAWTNGGDLSIIRGLIDFDISSIPSTATITSASLSLYHYPSTNNIGHSTLSGSNDSWLRRVTSDWDENTVNWNNQPSYTTQNQVNLAASTNDTMNYPNIDITNLFNDIWTNPTTSFGIILMLNSEQYYRAMLFASSDNADILKRPILKVCYENAAGISEANSSFDIDNVTLFPNPAKDLISISYLISKNSEVNIEFYSALGSKIDQLELGNQAIGKHSLEYKINSELFPAGIYFVKVVMNSGNATKRFVIN